MTRSEITKEIQSRRAQIATILDSIGDHQAIVTRLMTEQTVLEAELRGLEDTARALQLKIPKPANDN